MSTKEEIREFMLKAFPHDQNQIVAAEPMTATVRREVTKEDIRPGGTVSGPTLMGLADAAIYIAIHATLGLTPQAVTSNLSINFLRRPAGDRAVVAVCKLLKVGKTLIVGEVGLFSEGSDDPIAHVVGTYALPQSR